MVNKILDAIFEAIQNSPVSIFPPLLTLELHILGSLGGSVSKHYPWSKVRYPKLHWIHIDVINTVFYFRQVPLISEIKIVEIMEVNLYFPRVIVFLQRQPCTGPVQMFGR